MQERMLGERALAEVAGPWKDFMEKLEGREGALWFAAFKRFLRKENPWEAILEFLGVILVPATSETFVVGPDFGGAAWIGGNFKQWFFGKTEEPQPEVQIRYAQLLRRSVDSPIIAEIGGEAAAATPLAHIDWLLRQQSQGEEGVLLTNGWASIFYVPDKTGQLRAVGVGRDADGWRVSAPSVSGPDAWRGGLRVFSRNS